MKKFGVLVIAACVAVALCALTSNGVSARSPYRKQFEKLYEDSSIAEQVKEAKCNVCHYGKTKKNRNDFGMALSKHLSKDLYDKLKSDKEALNDKVTDAVKAVLKEKSVNGTTFGELIESGKLPGTAPAE